VSSDEPTIDPLPFFPATLSLHMPDKSTDRGRWGFSAGGLAGLVRRVTTGKTPAA
jgi:hypothetical protein